MPTCARQLTQMTEVDQEAVVILSDLQLIVSTWTQCFYEEPEIHILDDSYIFFMWNKYVDQAKFICTLDLAHRLPGWDFWFKQ